MTLAGTPATVTPGCTIFFTTTLPAPMQTLSAIDTLPIIFAPVPMYTLSPITAADVFPPVAPIVTPS